MTNKESTREVSGKSLLELGALHSDLVVLGGDLNKSTFANLFGNEYPTRFFDFGPSEQNIISAAAGMASYGKIPVVSTFAVFATSRPYDQLRVNVSQSGLNVKVVATHSGILTGEDGISAHSIEDIALMCALPGFTVIVPADATETEQVMRVAIETNGPFYIRLSRPATPVIHDKNNTFTLGKAEILQEGTEVSIIACGIMVSTALDAAKELEYSHGIKCKVINMATLKPIDEEAILAAANETGAIVTAEEHYKFGGLTSIVSQIVSGGTPVPIESVSLKGYAESGSPDQLLTKYNLSTEDIIKAVHRVVARKQP